MSAIATIVFAVVLFRTAGISDDAAITLRTVLNVTHGFGLTFNIAERVQTYTHPLWMGLLTLGYLVIRNVYITTFAIGMILSVIAYTVDVPGRARSTAFDTIVVATAAGDQHNALGHLLLEGNPATDGELYRRVAMRDGLIATK